VSNSKLLVLEEKIVQGRLDLGLYNLFARCGLTQCGKATVGVAARSPAVPASTDWVSQPSASNNWCRQQHPDFVVVECGVKHCVWTTLR